MSSLLFDRLLLTFINVKHRLEKLLALCRISENPSWINDEDCEEKYRFFGPYNTDIEELEESIEQISSLIENFQHEQNTHEDCKPFEDYPLCDNGWTLNKIVQLDEEQTLDLNILNQLSLHSITELDEQSNVNILDENKNHYFLFFCRISIEFPFQILL